MAVGVLAVPAGREVHAGDDTVTQVRDARHPGVDQCDRDAAAVDPVGDLTQPDRLPPREVGLEIVPRVRGDARHLDATVDGDLRDRGIAHEDRESVVRHGGGEAPDQGERVRHLAAEALDELLRDVRRRRRLVDRSRSDVERGSRDGLEQRRGDHRGDQDADHGGAVIRRGEGEGPAPGADLLHRGVLS